jgi:hypothetical protein
MIGSVRRRAGLRRGRIALAGALAATAVMAIGASSAQAVGFSATFDDAVLNLPAPAGNSDILDPPDSATMVGTVDTTTNALAVPTSGFNFPGFDGSLSGIPLHVEFSALDAITGTADASGNVTTNPSTYETVVALGDPINSDCTYNSDESFKTGSGAAFNGDAFTVTGVDPKVYDSGIVQTSWGASHFALTASTGDCSLVTNIINSNCGGLALGSGLTPAPLACAPPSGGATPPPATAPPKKKKCKKAKKKSASASKKSKCKKKKK